MIRCKRNRTTKQELLVPDEPIIKNISGEGAPKKAPPPPPPPSPSPSPSPSISKGDVVKLVRGRIAKAKHSNPSGTGMMEA